MTLRKKINDFLHNIKSYLQPEKYSADDFQGSTLDRMVIGNEKFLSDNSSRFDRQLIKELAQNGQKPKAVVVACSDSRLSPERLFNATLGDLFIIRTAGHIIGEIEIASIEYAVEHLGTNTIIVMGHRQCGAVLAASKISDENIGSKSRIIADTIRPSLEKARAFTTDKEELLKIAENFNIINTMNAIRKSWMINKLVENGTVQLIGAKCDIETGKVAFFNK